MENKDRLKVGLTVWVKTFGTRVSHKPSISKAVVTKVGRKYFEIDNERRFQFEIESLIMVTQYSGGSTVYFDEQTIIDEIELAELREFLRKQFYVFSPTKTKYSLDQLRRVRQILEEQ